MSDLGYGGEKPVELPVVPPAFQHPEPVAPPPQPPRRPRRRWVLPVIIVAAALVLALAGATVVVVLRGGDPTASPEAAVRGFVDDLAHGRAEHAVAGLASQPSGEGVLLTDAAYRDGGGDITGVRIRSTVPHGATATVVATVRARSGSTSVAFPVRKVRGGWHVGAQVLGRVSLVDDLPPGSSVEHLGKRVDLRSALPALPGTYRFTTATDSGYVQTEDRTVTVAMSASGDTAALSFDSPLTSSGQAQARSAVDAFYTACLAQTGSLHTTGGCGFGLIGEDGVTYTDVRWTATVRPQPEFGAWNGHGWGVSASKLGRIHLDATYHDGDQSGPADGDFEDAPLGGTASVDSSGRWRYESSLPDVT